MLDSISARTWRVSKMEKLTERVRKKQKRDREMEMEKKRVKLCRSQTAVGHYDSALFLSTAIYRDQ